MYCCVVFRYGKNATLSLTSTAPWTVLGVAALCQGAGQLFDVHFYPVTSNAGEMILLLGVSWIVYLVQCDLSITRNFAEFLHRSNLAFQDLPEPVDPPHHTHTVVHHHHRNEVVNSTPQQLPHPAHANHLQNLVNPADEARATEMVPVAAVGSGAADNV